VTREQKNYTGYQRHVVEETLNKLVGSRVAAPSGDVAGHAAGTVYEDLVFNAVSGVRSDGVFRQHEILNRVLLENESVTDPVERERLLGPPGQSRLLRRGVSSMEEWSSDNQFSYKQNDTADCVLIPVAASIQAPSDLDRLVMLDVKSHNSTRVSQAPNIISSKKLYEAGFDAVRACRESNREELSFEILYSFVSWELDGGDMVCNKTDTMSLFKTDPVSLRINWAAGGQIQFHPWDVGQEWSGTSVEWMVAYLEHRNASRERNLSRTRDECRKDAKLLEELLATDAV
jgi:type II restriction enzyme